MNIAIFWIGLLIFGAIALHSITLRQDLQRIAKAIENLEETVASKK